MSETNNVYGAFSGNSYLFGGNAPYVEELYEAYLNNPGSVPDNWRTYFDNLQHVPAVDGSDGHAGIGMWRWWRLERLRAGRQSIPAADLDRGR